MRNFKIICVIIFWICFAKIATNGQPGMQGQQDAFNVARLSLSERAGPLTDQGRREEILNVVNNSLSTESCKNAVFIQLGDGKQCLREGCTTLEGYKDLVSLVGCSDDDYNKLHDVICVSTDPPCTSPSPTIPGKTEDEKRREDILNVVNNSLSTESCKNAVFIQLGDGKQCLREGCTTLEGYKDLVSLVGCSDDDYNKLHDVICVSTDPPCTSPSPTIPGKTEDEKRREEILNVVNNSLSTESCKNAVSIQLGDGKQCLREGCTTLEGYKDLVSLVGCSDDDYNKLHDVICVSTDPPCTSPSPESTKVVDVTTKGAVNVVTTKGTPVSQEQLQKDQIRCTINTQLSSQKCKEVVAGQTSENDDLSKGCGKLESFSNLVTAVGCTQDDYNKLHDVICTWDGVERCKDYAQMQQNEIKKLENALSSACNISIHNGIKADNVTNYCTNLQDKTNDLISNKSCSSSEVANLTAMVCCSGQQCFERDIDLSTRKGQVTQAVRQLSNKKCSSAMVIGIDNFSEPPEQACRALEASRSTLFNGGVCSEKDYSRLEKVVCQFDTCNPIGGCTTTLDPFENEKEQRDRIKDVILNDIKGRCQDFMMEEAGNDISDPLEKTCKTFLDNYGFIVIGGQCSKDDYNKLKLVICGKSGTGRDLVNIAMLIFCAISLILKAFL